MKEYSESEALNKAAAYCTLCERCVSEVTAKLAAWGMDDAQQRRIIGRLKEEGFIDEARYCWAFVNDKVRFNRWGRIKISAALREKHLPQEYVREAMENIDEDAYMHALKEVIAAKRKELKGKDDIAAQQKIIRHAASRGYEASIILKEIKYQGDEMDF
ncbi:MAG: RecX family transcriptional regulator [Bacteroidaceae bacterium]|nr:RecX family transcriptional regulator [Bacteroidaceae bacterium]